MVLWCTGIHYCFGNSVHNRQATLGYFRGPVATHLLAPCSIPQAIEPFKVALFKKQRAVLTQHFHERPVAASHLMYKKGRFSETPRYLSPDTVPRPDSLLALWKTRTISTTFVAASPDPSAFPGQACSSPSEYERLL